MLSTIFLYISIDCFPDIQGNSVFSDLKKHNVSVIILENSNLPDKVFKKEETLFVSDNKDFLSMIQNSGYFGVGFSKKNVFLPVKYVFECFSDLDFLYFEHILQRYLGKPITIFSGKNLLIRELSNEDLLSLFRFCETFRNTTFIQGMATDFTNFQKQFQSYIANVYPFYDFGLWGVFSNEDNRLIGLFGLQNTTIDGQEEIELGYLLDTAYRRKGYAKEAILSIFEYARQVLACNRIVAKIHKDNTPSIATALSCGMQFEKNLSTPADHVLYVIHM